MEVLLAIPSVDTRQANRRHASMFKLGRLLQKQCVISNVGV